MPPTKNDGGESGGGGSKSSSDTKPADPENMIPKPNYSDPKSRAKYLTNWQSKYGPLENRGDHVLKVNETPRGANESIKNVVTKAAKEYGIDRSILYSSFMEEGGSGLFKNQDGTDTRHRKPGEFGYQGFYGDKDYPINGNESLGMPNFDQVFPDLVSKGYLPKDFANKFRGTKNAGEFSANDFKSLPDGLKAKAAWMKMTYDEVDKYAKDKGINLSNKARSFFALADFNSGTNFKKLMNEYHEKGVLEDDKFMKERPNKSKIPEKDDIWGHVSRRIKMADALRNEDLL